MYAQNDSNHYKINGQLNTIESYKPVDYVDEYYITFPCILEQCFFSSIFDVIKHLRTNREHNVVIFDLTRLTLMENMK